MDSNKSQENPLVILLGRFTEFIWHGLSKVSLVFILFPFISLFKLFAAAVRRAITYSNSLTLRVKEGSILSRLQYTGTSMMLVLLWMSVLTLLYVSIKSQEEMRAMKVILEKLQTDLSEVKQEAEQNKSGFIFFPSWT